MTAIPQQLEKEIFELIGKGYSTDSVIVINALEAASLILDNKFGKDFHKKNPKLAVRLTKSIMKNIRMRDLKEIINNGIGQHLDALRIAIENKDRKDQENLIDDFADSFKF